MKVYRLYYTVLIVRMSHGIDLNLIPESVRRNVADVIAALDATTQRLRIVEEALRLSLIRKYGPKSESLSDDQLQLLELEPAVAQDEVQGEAAVPAAEKESVTAPASGGRRRGQGGRTPLPANLPREVVHVGVPESECSCPKCQAATVVIGFEESEQLDVIPAQYRVLVLRREKRACRNCGEAGVRSAPAPERIQPKGKLSDALIIDVLIRKYLEHVPVYRQCASLERDHGIDLARQTLIDALMVAGDLMTALVEPMRKDLLQGGYIQADETTVGVQSPEVRGRNHLAYLWQYCRPGGPVVFDFQMGRSREGPREFLKGYRGWLQSDGYSAYADLGEGIRYAGCLVHARRKFVETSQVTPTASEPKEILCVFAQLYAVEKEARELGLDAAARLTLRKEKSAPVMRTLQRRLLELRMSEPPSSRLVEACDYTLKQWDRLEKYLEDGVLEADTNLCENGMRGVALGRKNWLHLGDKNAGPKVAAILSVLGTCQRLGINAREYLSDVLPRLGSWPITRVAELSPVAWLKARQS